jgi:hypothetical protein
MIPFVERDGRVREMKHGASRELFEYWNRLRGSERAPQRSAIEPSDLRRVLADTFILEVAGRERYDVRLAGTRVWTIYCREIKGSNFLDLFSGEDRSAMATLAAAVSEDGAAAVVTVNCATARGDQAAAELIMLPLRHSNAAAFDRVLGSIALMERPYWLGIEAVASQSITSLRLIWPDETPTYMRRRADRTGAAARPLTTVPPAQARRRGHLYVVDGGKA